MDENAAKEQLTPEEIKAGWYYPGSMERAWLNARRCAYRAVAVTRALIVVLPTMFRFVRIWGDRYSGELTRRVAVKLLEAARKKRSAQLRLLSREVMREYLRTEESE